MKRREKKYVNKLMAIIVTILFTVIITPVVKVKAADSVSVSYMTHVQKKGWESNWKTNGSSSGTTGEALRLEGIKIKTSGNSNLGISYSTHVQSIGWQNAVSNGEVAGTSGKALRLEAIKINLTGTDADKYDIYYRVHAQKFGWLDWAKNGEVSGTVGYAYRLEAIEIKIVEKGEKAPGNTTNPCKYKPASVTYRTQVQKLGWQGWSADGAMAGTSGKALRLEAIQIKVSDSQYSGGITYKTHVQKLGWQNAVSNGAMSGTTGKALRLEAIQMSLTGELAKNYDIYYRVHAQKFGWLDWAKNGQSAGTEGYAYRLEGIEIKIVAKGSAAPGSTKNPFINKSQSSNNNNGSNSGSNDSNNNGSNDNTDSSTIIKRNDGTYIKDGKIYFDAITNPLLPNKIGMDYSSIGEYEFLPDEEQKIIDLINEKRAVNGHDAITSTRISKDALPLCRFIALDVVEDNCFNWENLCDFYGSTADLYKGFGYYGKTGLDFDTTKGVFERSSRKATLKELEESILNQVQVNYNIIGKQGNPYAGEYMEPTKISVGVAHNKDGYAAILLLQF